MKAFVQGLVVGAALATATLVGYACGMSRDSAQAGTTDDNASVLEQGPCTVRVGLGRMTGGYQCRNNEVMVGMNSGNILCSDVQVSCL